MKTIRVVLTIFLLTLTGLAWVSQMGAAVKSDSIYRKGMEEAQALMDAKLYQKAVTALESALAVKESADARRMWRDAHELAYGDGVITKKQYVGAMATMAELQPKDADGWERLIGFCLEASDYNAAYSYSKKAQQAGASSEKLAGYQRQARYSYTAKGRVYTQVLQSPSGYSAVTDGKKWGIADPKGDWTMECEYAYLSPVTDSLVRLVRTEEALRILDGKEVVQSILQAEVDSAKAAGDGILPILRDGGWRYFDSKTSDFILGTYEDAASFAGGIAAVKEGGSWKLIDAEGGQVGTAAFEDIKLYGSGEYLYGGVFVAKSGGSYGLYSQKAELAAGGSCSDMDVYLGGDIAYQGQDGKWGFMDKKGKITIEPRYECARSFSDGLAAVCMDGKWGFIDASGELAVECRFLDVGYFTSGGICFVSELDGEYYMIALRFNEK